MPTWAKHHEHEAPDDAAKIGEGLAQDRDLEHCDHGDDWRQIAQRAEHEAGEGKESGRQSILLQPVEFTRHSTTNSGHGIGRRIHCDSGSDSFAI